MSESPQPKGPSRKARYWPWVRDIGLALLFITGIRIYQQRDVPEGVAPELAGVDLTGTPLALSDYRGKPVLLHFWATWCGMCRAEHSTIDAISRDLPVVTVAAQSGSADVVSAYLREHPWGARVIADPSGALVQQFGIHAFPTTFVLDGEGSIEHVEVGYSTELGLRARMWLARW